MSILEIVVGILLILSCLVIIGIVLAQEQKGQGLSSVITGTEMMNEGRARSREMRQVRITRVAAVVFFLLALAVNVLSVFSK